MLDIDTAAWQTAKAAARAVPFPVAIRYAWRNEPRAALLAQPSAIAVKSPWGSVTGSAFPGTQGSVSTRADADEKIVLLDFDFTEGGVYVGARALVLIDHKAGELRLRVLTGSPQKIGVRLRDPRGQWHQNEMSGKQCRTKATEAEVAQRAMPRRSTPAKLGFTLPPGFKQSTGLF